jgi:subtilisin family serine protease
MRLARLVPLAGVLLLVSCFSAHADEPVPLHPDARSSPSTDLDLDIGALPTKGPPKLESSLWQLLEAERRGGLGGLSVEAERSGITLRDAATRVVVEAQSGQASAVADTAASQGGVVETSYGDLVQVLAPVGSLEALSNSEGVRFVRQPTRYSPEVAGEGVGLVNANVWQVAGITGGGVKVAVLDAGFSGYSSLLGSELPSSVITQSFRADHDVTGGGEAHGTAVAEIVHEVAPGAQMYLVNFETDPELGNAVTWIVSQGIDVINFSLGCPLCGPGNGTGFDNDLVSWAVSNGVVWVNAAGNAANAHWAGDWYDPDGDAWQDFTFGDATNSVYLLAGASMWIGLQWDDPWNSSCNDYDLCLFDPSSSLIECTSDVQNRAGAPPVEELSYTAPSGGWYGIAIYRHSATGAVHFHLYIDPPYPMQYVVAAGSLLIPADNPNAVSVGAVPWSSPNTIESFSSQGPTEDGRTKPDLVGPDRVSGATYGPSGFAGTSAASPHVAGAAALVKQAFPSYTPAQIKTFLEGGAVALGAPGKDNIYGSGRLDLGSPPPTPTPTPTPTPVGGGVVSIGTATGAPGTDASAPLQVSNVPSPGAAAIKVHIVYDPSKVTPSTYSVGAGWDLVQCSLSYAPNTIRCDAVKATGLTGGALMANISFHVKGDASGCSVLDVQIVEFVDKDNNPIPASDEDGEICVVCTDTDADGVCDSEDQCPNTPSNERPVDSNGCSRHQVDQDMDGVCDPAAPSHDPSNCTGSDNCPTVPNPDQRDTDGDGQGNACEEAPPPPPTPSPTHSPTATATPTPSPTATPGVLATVATPMVAGWNDKCYIGDEVAIEDALTGIEDRVLAIYILNQSQGFDHWFPGKPDLSTIDTIHPYDQLFVLMSEAGTWKQEQSTHARASANLVQGWNSVCYGGATKGMDTATAAISGKIGLIYALQSDQTWGRYVPGRPEISDIAQCTWLEALLVLVTQESGATWVFNP